MTGRPWRAGMVHREPSGSLASTRSDSPASENSALVPGAKRSSRAARWRGCVWRHAGPADEFGCCVLWPRAGTYCGPGVWRSGPRARDVPQRILTCLFQRAVTSALRHELLVCLDEPYIGLLAAEAATTAKMSLGCWLKWAQPSECKKVLFDHRQVYRLDPSLTSRYREGVHLSTAAEYPQVSKLQS